MASVTASGGSRVGQSITFTGSGFSASTDYVLTISTPSGKTKPTVRTDGSGAFTYTFVVQEGGSHVCDVRPATEFTGTTTAAASSTAINADGKGK